MESGEYRRKNAETNEWKDDVQSVVLLDLLGVFRFCWRNWGRHNWKRLLKRLERDSENGQFERDLAEHISIMSINKMQEGSGEQCVACGAAIRGVVCCTTFGEPVHWGRLP